MLKVTASYQFVKLVGHGLFEFPPGIPNTYYGRTPSADKPLLFHQPFTRTIIIILLFPVQSLHGTPYNLYLSNNVPFFICMDAYLTLALPFYVAFADQHKLFIEKSSCHLSTLQACAI